MSLVQLVRTMHDICKFWRSNSGHHQKNRINNVLKVSQGLINFASKKNKYAWKFDIFVDNSIVFVFKKQINWFYNYPWKFVRLVMIIIRNIFNKLINFVVIRGNLLQLWWPSKFYNSRVYLNSFCLGKLDSRTRTSLPKIKIM